jgi:hypothetical protein
MNRSDTRTDPSLAPAADNPMQRRKKIRFGRAALWVGSAIALAAFGFYIGLAIYAGYYASS